MKFWYISITLAASCIFGQGMISTQDVQNDVKPPFRRINNGVSKPRGAVECFLCKLLMKELQLLYFQNASQAFIAKAVSKACVKLRIEDNSLCQHIASEFRDEVLYVIGKLIFSPSQLCSLFGADCAKPFLPWFDWSVRFPPNPKPPVSELRLPPPGSPTLRVLHLTDMHVDSRYTVGADADCGEPLCCRNRTNSTKAPKAGKWGYVGKCDLPLRTLENLLQHLSKQKYDYILWTGDLPPHDVWNQTRSGQLQIIKLLTDLMLKYFPETPIFPAIGNHEGVPVNSFPPNFQDLPTKYNISWLYDALADRWAPWIHSHETEDSIKRTASYEVQINDHFRIISINTNYGNPDNYWLYLNQSDPEGVLQWLVDRLQDAENRNIKVHIIGHSPTNRLMEQWSRNYYDIVNRYESTVRGQFFGHMHYDYFTVYYENYNQSDRATSHSYTAPSLTTWPDKNPGYRVYTIDGDWANSTHSVLDHESYFLNLTDANLSDNPQWKLLYTAKEAYNLTSLFASDWNGLIEKLNNGSSSFDSFIANYASASPAIDCSSRLCRRQLLCEMRSGRSYFPSLCNDLSGN